MGFEKKSVFLLSLILVCSVLVCGIITVSLVVSVRLIRATTTDEQSFPSPSKRVEYANGALKVDEDLRLYKSVLQWRADEPYQLQTEWPGGDREIEMTVLLTGDRTSAKPTYFMSYGRAGRFGEATDLFYSWLRPLVSIDPSVATEFSEWIKLDRHETGRDVAGHGAADDIILDAEDQHHRYVLRLTRSFGDGSLWSIGIGVERLEQERQ